MTDLQNHQNQSHTAMTDQQPLHKGNKLYRWSLIITATFALVSLVGLLISYSLNNIETVDSWMDFARPWLAMWRLLLFLLLIGGWKQWSRVYARWTGMDTEQMQRLLDYRWRMAAWLLVMEAILSQDVFLTFINTLLGA